MICNVIPGQDKICNRLSQFILIKDLVSVVKDTETGLIIDDCFASYKV
jgi:hypothetical protein